jgi:hypothetical protein
MEVLAQGHNVKPQSNFGGAVNDASVMSRVLKLVDSRRDTGGLIGVCRYVVGSCEDGAHGCRSTCKCGARASVNVRDTFSTATKASGLSSVHPRVRKSLPLRLLTAGAKVVWYSTGRH